MLKFISHRGNIEGKSKFENDPEYLNELIHMDYEIELDLWLVKNKLYLGHDKPTYLINDYYLANHANKIWIHCKDIETFNYIYNHQNFALFNAFYHTEEDLAVTTQNYIWQHSKNFDFNLFNWKSIGVLPELKNKIDKNFVYKLKNSKLLGICSDYIKNIKYIFDEI